MRRLAPVFAAAAIGTFAAGPARAQSTYEQLQAFSGLLNQIRLNYVDSVTYASLVHGAIAGVLRSLDPHSYFLTREDMERQFSFMAGTLAGTGIQLDEVDGLAVVLGVAPGSPAARGGLQAGDRLVAMNDSAVAGIPVQTLQTRMIGQKGARLRLRLERGPRIAPQSVTVSLKFDVIPARSVALAAPLDGETGYILLSGFYPETGKEVESAVKKLRGSGMRRLVLDLRENPGGVVAAASDVVALFVPKDTVVFRLVGRAAVDNQEFRTAKNGPFTDLPLVLLVNEHSASAAEVLAGSLQDLDRALIVGRRTFGKALVQRPFQLPPRGDVVYLTVARAVTPSGRIIQRRYDSLTAEQYREGAGRVSAPADTTKTFKTVGGRTVQGGGGVSPDVTLPRGAEMPVWWTEASSEWLESLVDSVAHTLDMAAFPRWKTAREEWRSRLALPVLARVRERHGIEPQADSALVARIARSTAYRATEVRWGTDRAGEFFLANDPEVRAAAAQFGKLGELLPRATR